MATMRELFAKLYAYVLLFEQADFQGAVQPSYEQVRGRIVALLEQQAGVVKRQRMEKDYQEALFAFVAWADETILKQSAWQSRNQWRASQLQFEYFTTRNAGEELFERLDELSSEQKEVREIYYLSLGLGFSGRYFLEEDASQLAQIRHAQAAHLPLPVDDVQHIDKLTPQPYQVAPPPSQGPPWPWEKVLLRVAMMLLVAVPVVWFVIYKLTGPSLAPLSPPVIPSKAPPAIGSRPPKITQQMIAERLTDLSCAKITVATLDAQTGVVQLAGRVASEAQRADINQRVRNIKGVAEVSDTFVVIPRPFCEVLEILDPFKAYAETKNVGLSMRLNKKAESPLYFSGENLVVDVQFPTAFKSYLYVDYYTADGSVGHLFPNPKESPQFFDVKSSYTVGRIGGPHPWLISPPFGLELVTVITSKTALFQPPRLQPESAESYLEVLRQAVKGVASSDIAATFIFITTRDQQ